MLFKIQTSNLNFDVITVLIATDNTSFNSRTFTELRATGNPITLEQDSDDLFSPIKPLGATIRILTDRYIPELYTSDPQGIKVQITNDTQGTTLYVGYVTPCIYTQEYTNIDELEIECVSPLSTLKYIDYDFVNGSPEIASWKDIIQYCITKCDFYSGYDISNELKINGVITNDTLSTLFQNENNFIDDDDEHTHWSCYKVLSEFCKLFCLTLVDDGAKPMFLDYTAINAGINTYTTNEGNNVTRTNHMNIEKDIYRSGGQDISMDDIYTKVNINANLYKDDIDMFDLSDDNLECIHPNIPYIRYDFIRPMEIKGEDDGGIIADYKEDGDEEYFKFYRNEEETGHHDFYRFYVLKDHKHLMWSSKWGYNPQTGTGTFGFNETSATVVTKDNYQDLVNANTEDEFKSLFINNYLLSNLCCFVVKHMSWSNSNKPKKYDWETCLFVSYGIWSKNGDYNAIFDQDLSTLLRQHYYASRGLPLLINDNKSQMVTIPDYHTYVEISGSVYFMRLPIVPAGENTVGSGNFLSTECTAWKNSSDKRKEFKQYKVAEYRDYGTLVSTYVGIGFPINDSSIGTISGYNGNRFVPNADANIDLQTALYAPDAVKIKDFNNAEAYYNVYKGFLYTWWDIDNQRIKYDETYLDNVIGYNGKLIEYKRDYFGNLSFTAPLPTYVTNNVAPNFCLIKNFGLKKKRSYDLEIAIEGEEPDDDVVYTDTTTDVFDTNNVDELDIELWINTQCGDKPLSLSSVIVNNGNGYEYASNLTFNSTVLGKTDMAEKLLATKYINHYNAPKIKYTGTFNGQYKPYTTVYEKHLNKTMVVDRYIFDVRLNKTKLNLIEY